MPEPVGDIWSSLTFYTIRFTPQKPTGAWSGRNIDCVERLIAEGRMRPAGLASFAHKDVHPYSGYRTSDRSLDTDEMLRRFEAPAEAWDFYQSQPAGYRRRSARWVMSAKREPTRQRRLTTLIEDSAQGLRIRQLRRR